MARYKIGAYVPQGNELAERVRALEAYVGRMSRELEYVLGHLDKYNFAAEERARIQYELTGKTGTNEEEME